MHRMLFCTLLLACNGSGGDDTQNGGDDDDDAGCSVTEANDLDDLTSELAGIDHECEDQPYYMPDIPTATTWYIGELIIDDCGDVSGTEIAYLYPNPKWVELDGYECVVTWNITGSLRDPFNTGDYGLDLEANVDGFNSTCPEDVNGNTFYSGFEFLELDYDVVQDGQGGISVLFVGGQRAGEEMATGQDNPNHVTYRTSTPQCALF